MLPRASSFSSLYPVVKMGLLDNKRIYCLGAVEELNEQTHRKLTQRCLAHRKDSDNVSCYCYEAGAHSPEALGGLVLPTAFTSEGLLVTADRS